MALMPLLSLKVTPITIISTLSLHDALPISAVPRPAAPRRPRRHVAVPCGERLRRRPRKGPRPPTGPSRRHRRGRERSEEHTSELQSLAYLVCRLLLEKKKQLFLARLTLIPI